MICRVYYELAGGLDEPAEKVEGVMILRGLSRTAEAGGAALRRLRDQGRLRGGMAVKLRVESVVEPVAGLVEPPVRPRYSGVTLERVTCQAGLALLPFTLAEGLGILTLALLVWSGIWILSRALVRLLDVMLPPVDQDEGRDHE